ncbi:universal stress protein [Natribaculum luteum]|uniref:Universal stress protein n=1 Tax=Natribaculum luteum TaxID=1586232 RepID=A0ABD5NXS5_9EURY|nr:universal stress protein [Natribaculum luteum]
MYERILLPTDGSDEAKQAADHAIDLAEKYDATLDVLSVVDTRAYDTEGITSVVIDGLEERGRRAVDEFAEMASDHGLERVETAVERGIPSETILEYVDEHDVDLIVMATHGRTGFRRYVLGSVTEKVVRTSSVPVHTVRVNPSLAD